jgi:DNA-binding transcriptional LysR family regulator
VESPFSGEAKPRPREARVPLLGPGMDLESLRCFEAVATTLRFRTAAERVHLSPAALSDRIRRLEENLGMRVLTRTTRSVALTDAGQRLLPLTRTVLGLIEGLAGAATGDQVPQQYELVVGTRYEVGLSWLCPILGPLSRKRPQRTVHLYNGSSKDLLAGLERGELDAMVASVRLSSPRLAYAALHDEEYLLVGIADVLRRKQDARRLTLVDISPDLPLFRYFLDAQPDAEPWPFARVEYMGGIANVRHRLLEGDGRVGVGPVEGLAPLDAIALEIVIGEIAALLARLRHDRPTDITIDEQPRAILGQPFESLGKLIVAENGARLHRLAGGGEDARDIRARGQDRGDDGEQIGLEVGERKALPGGAHGRFDQTLHRQSAQSLVQREQAGHHAWRGARAKSDMELLLGGSKIGVDREEIDFARRPALERRVGEEVKKRS